MVKEVGQSSGQKELNRSKNRGVEWERRKRWKGQGEAAFIYSRSRDASASSSHDDAIPIQASERQNYESMRSHHSSYDKDKTGSKRRGSLRWW
jgi:hypothetical protein